MDETSIWQKLGWMILIWSASIAALGAVTFVIRLWIVP